MDDTVKFAGFILDKKNRSLYRDNGLKNALHLEPKSFELLVFLVERPKQLLSKDEILNGVWGGTNVEESNIASNISKLRDTLEDEDTNIIKTISKSGYKFVADVEEINIQPKPKVEPDTELKPKPEPQPETKPIPPHLLEKIKQFITTFKSQLITLLVLVVVFSTIFYIYKIIYTEKKPCLSIISFHDEEIIGNNDKEKISGNRVIVKISGNPSNKVVWVFVQSLIKGSDQTWWGNPAKFDNKNNQWETEARFGIDDEKGEFNVMAVAVNEENSKIFQDWLNAPMKDKTGNPKTGKTYQEVIKYSEECRSDIIKVSNEP